MILQRLGTDDITISPITNWTPVTLHNLNIVAVSQEQWLMLKAQYWETNFKEVNNMNDYFVVIVP